MNNFFLLNESLNISAILDFELGIKNLTEIFIIKNSDLDTFLYHEDFWNYETHLGFIYDIPNKIDNELVELFYKLFGSFNSIPNYITDEQCFDRIFNNDCNGFMGIDFSSTVITNERQIIDPTSFKLFKHKCAETIAYNSIQNFWANRTTLFPNLVFCEHVYGQIEHLSVNDDRFKLINNKLEVLNAFTNNWKDGAFEIKKLGLDNSPDTPTRVKSTSTLRTFSCPPIGDKIFSLHIKWYFGKEPFRMYYFPNEENHNVYIGYIGPKDEIGF